MPDFIGIYKKILSDDLCDQLINIVDKTITTKGSFYYNTAHRKDYQILLDWIDPDGVLSIEVNSALDRANKEYMSQYMTSLGDLSYSSWRIKLQKTPIGGGFHKWHCEQITNCDRILVWTIYLNDMPEGEGETEFINYPKKIKPNKGDVVIFPASFTHTHRGNPPLTTEKYIATGWWNLIA